MAEPGTVISFTGEFTEADFETFRIAWKAAYDSRSRLLLPRDHVIVKGWHDQGKIEAVYGPYAKERAEWIYGEFLADGCGNNWTVVKLSDYGADGLT